LKTNHLATLVWRTTKAVANHFRWARLKSGKKLFTVKGEEEHHLGFSK
jgi:hypothetical protein